MLLEFGGQLIMKSMYVTQSLYILEEYVRPRREGT